MDAKQARELTSISTPDRIAPTLAKVYDKIREVAKKGRTSIRGPLVGMNLESAEVLGIYARLRQQGYSIIDHPDPDPGHPCSRPYTELSW